MKKKGVPLGCSNNNRRYLECWYLSVTREFRNAATNGPPLQEECKPVQNMHRPSSTQNLDTIRHPNCLWRLCIQEMSGRQTVTANREGNEPDR